MAYWIGWLFCWPHLGSCGSVLLGPGPSWDIWDTWQDSLQGHPDLLSGKAVSLANPSHMSKPSVRVGEGIHKDVDSEKGDSLRVITQTIYPNSLCNVGLTGSWNEDDEDTHSNHSIILLLIIYAI